MTLDLPHVGGGTLAIGRLVRFLVGKTRFSRRGNRLSDRTVEDYPTALEWSSL
jgi:hypothetical protein